MTAASGVRRAGSDPLRGLLLACHPGPTVTVTVAVTALAAAGGRDALGCVVVLCAVLTGQLSVGWSNDALDAARDAAVGRSDKPVVAGLIDRRAVAVAAGCALVVSVVLSFVAAGVIGGVCHVVFLASAWAYNFGLKRTRVSLVAYAVGFGALPGFVTYGLDPSRPPRPWAVVVTALLGIAAGLANAEPDIDDDVATDVHGAVARMGAQTSRRACAVALSAATVVLVFGAGFALPAALGAVVLAVVVVVAGLRFAGGRRLFTAVMLLAVLDVGLLLLASGSLD